MKIDIEHYVNIYKQHEAQCVSTNDRTAYWIQYQKEKEERENYTPPSKARFEHG
jgi:hypothetical protein